MMRCKACGETIEGRREYLISQAVEREVTAKERRASAGYCSECALEVVFDILLGTPARTFPTGAGCPLEPNDDDASPWQENNIRLMEG